MSTIGTIWTLRFIICLLCCRASLAELKLIQTVFRHGNKTPSNITFYPNDPYINCTYEPVGRGDLTNVGKMTMYQVGQFFRERYEDFLGEIYTKKKIWFRSDKIDRTVMSGQLVATGLYPPSKIQRWNPDLNWQPIPIWTMPIAMDCLYNTRYSSKFHILRNIVEETDENVIQFEKDNKDIYKYLSEHTGGNITQLRVFILYKYLFEQKDIGLELPEWTKSVFPGKLEELAVYDISISIRTLESKQILAGIWIREWLNHVNDYISKNDTRKAFMYAAHDINIAYILSALDNFDNEIPYFGSSLMFELHEDNNEYYVQMLYKNKDNIRVLEFPNCDKMCPLDEFKKFVKPLISFNMEEVCRQI
ncbi:venom acid phosphatase Acph-1-like isoform X1 [Apis florea]|uniref:venom acid phosphatase Acph-1-like isoform X1 n=2 Tax=Apis florea TaxID=7463 RepID=UPI0012FE9011|nr:venom acid phosphatase Acph-1-like isoform X1 [Apis florea]